MSQLNFSKLPGLKGILLSLAVGFISFCSVNAQDTKNHETKNRSKLVGDFFDCSSCGDCNPCSGECYQCMQLEVYKVNLEDEDLF